jgi:RES domain-containing protein
MTSVWRLTPPTYAVLLDGEGSRIAGGQWNSLAQAALYTSSHLSLSVLEVFVHMPPEARDDLPEMEAVQIYVPDEVRALEITSAHFERLMTTSDPITACQAVGDEWLASGVALVLKASSVLVPEELNVMLNPAHPEMRRIRIESSRRFRFDPWLARPL